jgi:DNA-binding NtrC family response regulator
VDRDLLVGREHADRLGERRVRPPERHAVAERVASRGRRVRAPELVCDGHLTLDEIERRSIVATLERYRGHRQKSAKALGIGVRTLGLKLKKWKEESLVPAEL